MTHSPLPALQLCASHLLIAGYGRLGQLLARCLQPYTQLRISAVRRSPAQPQSQVNLISADLCQAESLQHCPADVDTIVYCPTPDQRSAAAYEAIYINGLENLLQHYAASRQLRVILVSSTAVYAQHDNQWVDETSPTEAQQFNGKTLLAAENLVRDRIEQHCCLRLAGLYQQLPQRYLQQLQNLDSIEPQQLGRWTNRIHLEDAARLCVLLLQLPQLPGIVNGSDGHPVTVYEILHWLSQNQSDDPTHWRPPTALESPPQTHGKRVSNRLARELGYVPQYPDFRSGFQ